MKRKRFWLIALGMAFWANAATAKIDIYYFKDDHPCLNCRKMEKYAKALVNELADTDYVTIDLKAPETKADIEKYGLYTKTFVLIRDDGKWRKLDRALIWADDEQRFKAYFHREIGALEAEKR